MELKSQFLTFSPISSTAEANDLFREIHQEYFLFPVAPNDWQPCSFQPIFQHPLAMGQYYIRLWMEVNR